MSLLSIRSTLAQAVAIRGKRDIVQTPPKDQSLTLPV